MTVDPDVVRLLAVLLHARECRHATKPYALFSAQHQRTHEAGAEFLLSGLRDAGLVVTSKES